MEFKFKISNGIRNVYWPIVAIIIVKEFVSPEVFFAINLAWLLYVMVISGKLIWLPIWGYGILVLYLLWGSLMALTGDVKTVDFVRDFFYYTNPLVFLLSGAYFAKIGIGKTKYFNSLILGSAILVIMYLVGLAFGRTEMIITGHLWIPMALLLLNRFDDGESFSRPVRIILIVLFIFPLVISFSRVSIVFILAITLVSLTDRISVYGVFKMIIVALCLIAIGVMLYNTALPSKKKKEYDNKIEKTLNEANPNQDWDDEAVVTDNWRGYELHRVMIEFRKGNAIQELFGYGFGKKVYVGRYAYYLLDIYEENGKGSLYIPVTHNGYANMLMKTGLIGMLLLIFFYINLIVKSIKFARKYNKWEGRLLAGIIVGLIFMTYILNGMYKDVCYYEMVTTIGYLGYRLKYYDPEEDEENETNEEVKDENQVQRNIKQL